MVAAKLLVPSVRPETLARNRLTRLLATRTRSRITIVSAPAGYGKTTALVEWLRHTQRDCAWVSLDSRDNDPQRFCAHLLAALDGAVPGVMGDAQRALGAGSDLLDTVVPTAANALGEGLDEPLVLVLDDYQFVENTSCHRLLSALIDAAPAGLHLVLASRTRPPLRLGRRRAAGDVAEVGPEELRFRINETDRLLNGSLGLDLDRDQVDAIDGRLRGWAAGLSLVASSLGTRTDRDRFLQTLGAARGRIATYLIEEVLDGVGPRLRGFLCETSILTRLSAPLCEAVLRDPSAATLLEEVRRSNLFVTRLEDDITTGHEWLVLHPLFRELLERDLDQRAPELVPELHRRAAEWFTTEGNAEEAIRHASAAGEGELAAELLHDHWRKFLAERRYVTMRRLIAELPNERGSFGAFCEALDTLCMALTGTDLRLVAQRLDALERDRGKPGVAGILDQMRVSPYYGDVGQAVEAGRSLWRRYAGDLQLQASVAGQFGTVLWFAGRYDEARDVLEPMLGEIERETARIWALAALSLCAADEGDVAQAEARAREAVALTEASGAESALESLNAYVALAEALRLRGALADTELHLAHAAHLTDKLPGSMYQAFTLVFQAQLALASRDRRAARTLAAAARRIVDRYPDTGTIGKRLARIESALERRTDDALLGSRPTPAEMRLLELLPSDLTLKEIAAELYVSINTVTSHARRLYRRLGVRTRAEAVATARERGLI